jgi:RNA polymerase sigma-32 factor
MPCNPSRIMTERAHHQDRPTPLLATEEERQLIGRYRTGSQKALETLIQSHMPLVRSIARRYRGHARHDDDLLAEGRLGLLQAAQRFEPERGVRFAVYAAWWVRAFVRRYALDNRRIVRAPSTRMGRKLASKLPSTVQKLRQTRGREVSDAELASELEAPIEEVASVRLALSMPDLMLDDESARAGALVDPGASPEELASSRERQRRIEREIAHALGFLSNREREIVERRYLDDEGATLATLGEHLGISRERVRQLEARAREKLRDHLVDVA